MRVRISARVCGHKRTRVCVRGRRNSGPAPLPVTTAAAAAAVRRRAGMDWAPQEATAKWRPPPALSHPGVARRCDRRCDAHTAARHAEPSRAGIALAMAAPPPRRLREAARGAGSSWHDGRQKPLARVPALLRGRGRYVGPSAREKVSERASERERERERARGPAQPPPPPVGTALAPPSRRNGDTAAAAGVRHGRGLASRGVPPGGAGDATARRRARWSGDATWTGPATRTGPGYILFID